MIDDASRDAFILANTVVAMPPLVPEIRLRLASAVLPMWQATEDALQEIGVEPPYWAFCWPGGQALARLLLDSPERVRGRTVLDLAAGCGVAAIAAARSGADAIANDIDPLALRAIALNAALNDVPVGVRAANMLDRTPWAGWQVILAGDVCYQRPMAARCIEWLRSQAATGSDVLLADPGRAYLPCSGLTPVAQYTVPTSRDLEDRDVRECTIWRVLP